MLTKSDGPVTCVNVTENVVNFQSKFYHFTATQTSVTLSVKQHEHLFCWFQRNKDAITIVAQHMHDLFTTMAEQPSERLKCFGYLEPGIFKYESRDIFSQDIWHTRQTLTKWRIKVPKANSRWFVESLTTWINVNLMSSLRSCCIHLMAISQLIRMLPFFKTCLKMCI